MPLSAPPAVDRLQPVTDTVGMKSLSNPTDICPDRVPPERAGSPSAWLELPAPVIDPPEMLAPPIPWTHSPGPGPDTWPPEMLAVPLSTITPACGSWFPPDTEPPE